MKRKLSIVTTIILLLTSITAISEATLIAIGKASYNGSAYNLIWDDANNGNSIVWLDYTNPATDWSLQNSWAAGLNTSLSINLNTGYSVDWGANSWRLPTTIDGISVEGYDGNTTTGYNITSSEMGHLYYSIEPIGLENLGRYDRSGNLQSDFGLINTGNFNNLTAFWYWSGSEYAHSSDFAWGFNMFGGWQSTSNKSNNYLYGLAVRTGQVSIVPEPSTIILLSLGLIFIMGINRKIQG